MKKSALIRHSANFQTRPKLGVQLERDGAALGSEVIFILGHDADVRRLGVFQPSRGAEDNRAETKAQVEMLAQLPEQERNIAAWRFYHGFSSGKPRKGKGHLRECAVIQHQTPKI